MSYCRFSSDDYQCDVYAYESCYGGFTIHVAGNRPVFKEPLPPVVPFDQDHLNEWFDRHSKIMEMMKTIERVDIGLPHDGATINLDTASECADQLEALRAMGYNVPQYAIDALREEAAA